MASFIIRHIDAALMERVKARAEAEGVTVKAAILAQLEQYVSVPSAIEEVDVQLLAWAVCNCHMLARRALAHESGVYSHPNPAYHSEKWQHVQRICEQAGATSQGVLRASLPTEITNG